MVPTTQGAVSNPGLMQSHNGASYDGTDGSILQMIRDGVEGTGQDGDRGLRGSIEQFRGVFAGLKAYNSGAQGVDLKNLSSLPRGTGTAAYCSQIANRLTGRLVERA
ncbi:MAG: hypothetical protein MMC23_010147 [Stictis urceolatum]|nr:hypothetical protein [Stictis urceolata]